MTISSVTFGDAEFRFTMALFRTTDGSMRPHLRQNGARRRRSV